MKLGFKARPDPYFEDFAVYVEVKGSDNWPHIPVLQSGYPFPHFFLLPRESFLKQTPDIMLSNGQTCAMGLMFPSVAELESEAWRAEEMGRRHIFASLGLIIN